VRILTVETESPVTDLGAERHIDALVALGPLDPADVAVELLHGAVGPNDELLAPQKVAMALLDGGTEEHGQHRYAGRFACEVAGRYGFTVRVVPFHPDLTTALEMGSIAWA
jgi:starch phosphorylase